MERAGLKRKWVGAAYLVLAVATLANSGCLLVAAGAAAGGAAGYAYVQGNVSHTYNADLANTRAAVHSALNDLGMPVEKEEQDAAGAFIQTRLADGDPVKIHLETLASRIPAEGPLTEVGVRVATFGDHPMSERIHYQVGAHLASGSGATPPPPLAPTLGPVQPAAGAPGVLTAEPPLAK
jgi:hypothetical protein